jgi:hypothetical protein
MAPMHQSRWNMATAVEHRTRCNSKRSGHSMLHVQHASFPAADERRSHTLPAYLKEVTYCWCSVLRSSRPAGLSTACICWNLRAIGRPMSVESRLCGGLGCLHALVVRAERHEREEAQLQSVDVRGRQDVRLARRDHVHQDVHHVLVESLVVYLPQGGSTQTV